MPKNVRRCPPELWDDKQLLSKCEGFKEFSRGEIESSYLKVFKLLQINGNTRMLDVGCGRGEMVRKCSEITDHAFGIDQSPAAVRISSGFTEGGAIVQGSSTSLPFGNGVFDLISMLGFIECLCEEDVGQSLEECKRVLKPGGKILITTPNSLGNSILGFLERTYSWLYNPNRNRPNADWYQSKFVCSTWNYLSLKRILKKHGFKSIIWYEPAKSGRIRSVLLRILFFTGPMYCWAYR